MRYVTTFQPLSPTSGAKAGQIGERDHCAPIQSGSISDQMSIYSRSIATDISLICHDDGAFFG
jgi:hypothetical protein